MKERLIINNATIVTVNNRNEIIDGGSIVVEGQRIKAIGKASEIARKYSAEKQINAAGMVAMPGLINGHVHTITSLYKGTMVGFGFEKTMGEDTALAFRSTPEVMLAASRLAAAEMLLAGTTLANVATDATTYEVSRQTADALGGAGMRAFVQTALVDIFGPTGLGVHTQLAEARKLLHNYHGAFDGRIRVSLGPASEVTTTLKTMRLLSELAQKEDLIIHMHVFPRWPTGIFSLLFRGRSPIGLLKEGRLLNKRLLAVHFLAAKSGDINTIAKAGASVVHCPSVWMNAGIGPKHWLPIKAMHKEGVNIILGTDSFGGWLEGSDMFTEMRNCALMSNFLYGAGSLKPTEILRMATINGAKALGLEKEIGSLEVGKKADIVLLKFNPVLTQPSYDMLAMIVYAISGRDVHTVLINGSVVVENRTLLTLDEREVLEKASRAREELYRIAGWSLSEKKATSPTSSWLERYPNEKVARLGLNLSRIRGWLRMK